MKRVLTKIFYLILYSFIMQIITQSLQYYLIGEINPFRYLGNHIPFFLNDFIILIMLSDFVYYINGINYDKKIFQKSDLYLLLFNTITYFIWVAYYTYKYYKN